MAFTIYKKLTSVVVVGEFNPRNFVPERLKVFDVLTDKECDEAEFSFNHDTLQIKFSWVDLLVTPGRLMVQMDSEGFNHLFNDLVISLLSLFETTIVSAIGLNCQYYSFIKDKRNWDKLGDSLLPKEVWRKALNDTDCHIGTISAKVEVQDFFDSPVIGGLNIELRPLLKNEKYHRPYAFMVNFNGHFEVDETSIGVPVQIIEGNLNRLSEDYPVYLTKLINGALKCQA